KLKAEKQRQEFLCGRWKSGNPSVYKYLCKRSPHQIRRTDENGNQKRASRRADQGLQKAGGPDRRDGAAQAAHESIDGAGVRRRAYGPPGLRETRSGRVPQRQLKERNDRKDRQGRLRRNRGGNAARPQWQL